MRVWLKAVGLSAVVLAAWGCPEEDPGPQCTEIECAGGFVLWVTSTNESQVYDSGRYDIWIDVADGELFVQCFVEDDGSGNCLDYRWDEQPSSEVSVSIRYGIPENQGAIDTPAIQLQFAILTEADAGTNVAGPTMVRAEIDRQTREVGDITYMPTYERFDDYFGPEECGFCESLTREVLRLDP